MPEHIFKLYLIEISVYLIVVLSNTATDKWEKIYALQNKIRTKNSNLGIFEEFPFWGVSIVLIRN